MKKVLFLLVFLPVVGFTQKFAHKDYYLNDSINLQEIDSVDLHIIDSCFTVYYSNTIDTNKANALAYITNNIQYDKWYLFLFSEREALRTLIAQQKDTLILKHLHNKLALCYYYIGFFYYGDESASFYDNDSSFHYLFKSLKIFEELKDKKGQRGVSNNIGAYYNKQGNIPKALEFYYKCLKIDEETGDSVGIANSYNILGSVAKDENEYEKALEFYHKSMKIAQAINKDYSIASALNNIANVYLLQFEKDSILKNDSSLIEKAHNNYTQSLNLFKEINNNYGVASETYKIGTVALLKKEYKKAINYFEESLEIFRPMKNKLSLSMVLERLAKAELGIGRVESAENNAKKSLEIAQQINYPTYIKNASETLSEIYEQKGEGIKALEMFKLYIKNRDIIYNKESLKAKIVERTKYEYEKQKSLDDLKNEKLLTIEKKEKEKQQVYTYSGVAGVFLMLLVTGLIFRGYRQKKQANILIGEQKHEAEAQRDIATTQKLIVEEKNKEILESITYAKRIQEAILPPPRLVKEWLTESFIFYKPKDIVAGDFYWMETSTQKIDGKEKTLVYFAAADCTGHGVPGAMVSVVCANALNKALKEFNLIEPGHVLDKVTELVLEAFEKSEEEIKDGMDIALCAMDISAKKIYYSGANNPLYRITAINNKIKSISNTYTNETHQLIEYKATKQPVGFYENAKQFDTIEIQLEPGDAIYVFSDGFADQFGGVKGKKYKYSSFRQCLLGNFTHPMETQKQLLEKEFENWKGELEQVDDVCVIGVKINGVEKNNFTKRELEVLKHLEEGLPSKLIADKMNISKHTVDTYRRRLLAKTGTYNATELINYCIKKEII